MQNKVLETHTKFNPIKLEIQEYKSEEVMDQPEIKQECDDNDVELGFEIKTEQFHNSETKAEHSDDTPPTRDYIVKIEGGCDISEESITEFDLKTEICEEPLMKSESFNDKKESDNFSNKDEETTAEKPYKCANCDKLFKLKYELIQHLETYTGDKPFKCQFCYKSYKGKFNLKKHYKTRHKQKFILGLRQNIN